MKILHIVHKPRMSGAEMLVAGLTRYHKKLGHTSHVVSYNTCAPEFEIILKDQEELGVKWHTPDSELSYLGKFNFLKNITKDIEPDIIFAHTVIPSAYSRLSMLKKVIVVLHAENNFKEMVWRYLEYFLQYRVKNVICVSQVAIEKYRKYYKWPEVHYIPNGIDLEIKSSQSVDLVKGKLNICPTHKVIIQVGRVLNVKRQHLSIQLIKDLALEGIEATLLIVGIIEDEDYYATLKKTIEQYNLDQNVKFLGGRHDIPDLLAISDLFVMPSIQEAQPIALIEAIAFNLPIIATNVNGFKFAENIEGVCLINVQDSRKYTEIAMTKLLSNEKYDRDAHRFSLEKCAKSYVDIAKTYFK